MSNTILVIDDKENICKLLSAHLSGEGYDVATAPDGETGVEMFRAAAHDLVITDVKMPGMSGLDVLRQIKNLSPDTIVLLITAFADMDDAIAAMKMGAFDYLKKPFKLEEIQATVEKALEHQRLRNENRLLRAELEKKYRFDNIIARSKSMHDVFDRVQRVAGASSTVLITGETGTGKELIARAVHYNSTRKNKNFVVVNCGAIPSTLIESELFGHVRGAFTDAIANKPGRFEEAHEGTIFLDEIGELDPAVQGKLLRTLQECEITRIGENHSRKVDARVIAATNRNLEDMVAAGTFRSDLFYRINVVPIDLPPLRKRPEDIPLLLRHFLDLYSAENHLPVRNFSPAAMGRILSHAWPGNVRELMNLIERCVLMSEGAEIGIDDLPPEIASDNVKHERGTPLTGDGDLFIQLPKDELSLKIILDQATAAIEKEMIDRALRHVNGNKDRAAQILEISRRSLFYKLRQYGIH